MNEQTVLFSHEFTTDKKSWQKAIWRYQRFHLYRVMKVPVILFALFMLYSSARNSDSQTLFDNLIMSGITSLVLCFLSSELALFIAYKQLAKNCTYAKVSLTFYEEKIVYDSASDNWSQNLVYYYRGFKKVYETKHAFYLYTSKKAAIILTKANLQSDQIDYLRNLFSHKFKNKFKGAKK
ncbi:MAG: YcxB family protein [Oscillospiraceae bacterium]|nr:YcxB family protein [Oscillospiraceae bacterium]